MGWTAIIAIIAQYGLPLAESLWQKWSTGTVPTQADWDQLRALANTSAADIMRQRLAAAGIALDSPEAIALLAQVGGASAVAPDPAVSILPTEPS
jgi:hypothetical protein